MFFPDSNKVKIGNSGAIPSLVRLCDSPDRRVAHNAVGTILNLSHAERNRGKLVDAGALPILVRLLLAADNDERYYSAAALSNIAVDGAALGTSQARKNAILSLLLLFSNRRRAAETPA